jgi:hypothetical protein
MDTVRDAEAGQYADILKIAVFLYVIPDHAKAGLSSGGTGFLLAIPSERYGESFREVLKNAEWVLICDAGA